MNPTEKEVKYVCLISEAIDIIRNAGLEEKADWLLKQMDEVSGVSSR